MEQFSRLQQTLKQSDATLLHLLIFGSLKATAAATEAMRRQFGAMDWPVTWVEGASCHGSPIAGIQAFTVRGGVEVERIRMDERVVGSVFTDGAGRHCLLGGVEPGQKSGSRVDQAQQTFENLERTFAQAGFAYADTVRTWFFLDDILSWYDEFNQVRTRAYSGIRFPTGSPPASTGVAGRNPAGAALTAGAWALQPAPAFTCVCAVDSPRQCPAPAYGSTFSRAMEIVGTAGRRLLISGTASIAPDGRTAWPGDARRQVELTMEVTEAILRSRGFAWPELTRATAYFKHRADVGAFADWCAARDLRSLPAVAVCCDLCRDDLLFEFEADAWHGGALLAQDE